MIDGGDDADPDEDAAVELPIDGVLDLHTFAPRDVAEVVAAYVDECARRNLGEVRIIHGKGRGVQREIVRRVLAAHPLVERIVAAGESEGGWGATKALLK